MNSSIWIWTTYVSLDRSENSCP